MAIYNDVMTQVFSQMSSVSPMRSTMPRATQATEERQDKGKSKDENTENTLNIIGLAINREGGMSI